MTNPIQSTQESTSMTYERIGLGGTCYVTTTDHKTVLKGHQVWRDGKFFLGRDNCEDDLARGATIYDHLGSHPQILRCFGLEQHAPGFHSLRLEFAPLSCVRQFIMEQPLPLPLNDRLQMALDVVTGLAYIHSKGVQHCDMSCRNLFMFPRFRVKLGDFGASLFLPGHEHKNKYEPTFCEEPRYELPLRGRKFSERPAIKRELFALGSAMYEITSWRRPFQGLSDEEVEARYARGEFPCVEGNPLEAVILKRWNEEFESAQEVLEALTHTCIPLEAATDAGDESSFSKDHGSSSPPRIGKGMSMDRHP